MIGRSLRVAGAAALVVAGAGLIGCAGANHDSGRMDGATATEPLAAVHAPASPTPAPTLTQAGSPAERVAEPVAIRIPAVGIDSSLEHLQVDRRGVLQAPNDPDLAGWFAAGTRPGEIGPAVIAGHVDSRSGPAVFASLRKVRVGEIVQVRRADHSVATFRVVERRHFARADFPVEAVYGPTPDRALRLITCAGEFRSGGYGYVDNLVVTAIEVER